jgi:1-acyl-sn-glycerol-3-phosphate acyltransferase
MAETASASRVVFSPPEYHTPERVPSPGMWRLLPAPGLRFYGGMLACVLRARRLAGRGQFDTARRVAISQGVVRMAEWVGAQLHVTGLDVLYSTPGPVVVVANHMSTLDTFLVPGLVEPAKPLTYVVKSSLVTHPFFGPVTRALPHIPVGRRNPREDLQIVLDQGIARLRAGVSMCIFPQATRSDCFDENHFNTLGIKLARRAGAMVIPLALRTDFWGNGRWLKDLGPIRPERTVHVAFGPAVPADLAPAAAHAQVVAFIRERLMAWGVPCIARGAPQAAEGAC